ncbi:MAG: hypothetical protein A2Y82_03465 [Candidatus Buchananbacteria bacterium RBG_13_36_9]|uniref:Uncharacterized protein n=1 Tax=Candidatus Buchananbacteria bacterium RBG_13_36_9 TaxID=1797530 RepID=A0A1G1XLR6_9BACT|nr:MAG: hypothetical protein A2Y82_03465 [Candidatus Buchananbacteria bacterium RBG_13_36_9]
MGGIKIIIINFKNMSRFEGTSKFEAEQEEKKEPEFEYGQKVIVQRSDGRLEKGWEVDAIGKRIKVINKIQKKGKWVDPEDLQEWTEIGFETNEPVMVERKNGQLESGWEVKDFGKGFIEVINKEGQRKVVSVEELKEWNKK